MTLTNGGTHRGEIQTPPHADEIEQTFMSDMSSLLQRQSAMQAERMAELMEVQSKLDHQLVNASRVADQFLRMYTDILVKVRLHTEAGTSLLNEFQQNYGSQLEIVERLLSGMVRKQ